MLREGRIFISCRKWGNGFNTDGRNNIYNCNNIYSNSNENNLSSVGIFFKETVTQ
jgi:hypothetical protein